MASERLFGNKIMPACKYCREGFADGRGESILCSRHGVVDPSYKCRYFFYDPLLRIPKRPAPLDQYDLASFTLEDI